MLQRWPAWPLKEFLRMQSSRPVALVAEAFHRMLSAGQHDVSVCSRSCVIEAIKRFWFGRTPHRSELVIFLVGVFAVPEPKTPSFPDVPAHGCHQLRH